jgi:curved DNA-binding protein CbpA
MASHDLKGEGTLSHPLPDYYRLLNVPPTSGVATIHASYRALARRLHPDVSGDDTAMKELNVAWDTLRDPRRRAAYDRDRMAARPAEPIIFGNAEPAAEAFTSVTPDHAGPPPGRPFGPILTYGRYAGWSLGEIAQHDPGFLRWLRRVPAGRQFAADIDAVFAELQERPLTLGGRRPLGGFATRRYATVGAEA